MALIVMKFGGSSVADTQCLYRVAERITDTYQRGNDVVVVLSAQGDTTDDLIAKAQEVNPDGSRRELGNVITSPAARKILGYSQMDYYTPVKPRA